MEFSFFFTIIMPHSSQLTQLAPVKFTYLGSEITRDRGIERDVKTHIQKANSAFI
jgi:hypothetical protein